MPIADARVMVGWQSRLGEMVDQDEVGNPRLWFTAASGEEQDAEGPMPVFLNLQRNAAGKVICSGLIIGDLPRWAPVEPREVNAARLRSIHLPALIRRAVLFVDAPDDLGRALRDLLQDIRPTGTGPGPRGYDDEHFRKVAATYRAALAAAPRAPTKWLAEREKVSLATARRWVQRARDRGFLGASEPGKAGEFGDTE